MEKILTNKGTKPISHGEGLGEVLASKVFFNHPDLNNFLVKKNPYQIPMNQAATPFQDI